MIRGEHILRIRSLCACGRTHGVTLETISQGDLYRFTIPVYFTCEYRIGADIPYRRYKLRGYDTEWCVRDYKTRGNVPSLAPYVAVAVSADRGHPLLVVAPPVRVGGTVPAKIGTAAEQEPGYTPQAWTIRAGHVSVMPSFPRIDPGPGDYTFQHGVE